MFSNKAYELGAEFSARAGSFKQPLFVIAHQDDELGYAGLISRLDTKTKFVWLTNGDGLYFESDLKPEAYGELRMAEALRSLAAAGIPPENAVNLKFSEIEIYRRMSELYSGKSTMRENREFFSGMHDRVREAVFAAKPDAVFTLAWQGGQPEHDLAHFFTMLAVRDYRKESGEKVEFFHLPEYEYTILVAMRFHPLYRGTRMRLRLNGEEMARKRAMIEAYPSQVRLFNEFRRVFFWLGMLGRLTGGPKSADEYFSIEEFGPVPENLDYTKKPHFHDYFTYMFDHFEGVPVTFSRSILPVVKEFISRG